MELIQKNDIDVLKADSCDKYDYLISVGCGVLAGLVDVFLVGSPNDSKLLKWTDEQVNSCVRSFAKLNGWNGAKNGNTASAIGFLEKKFPVNYDHRHGGDVDRLFSMSTKNHHMKSLAHSPSPIGLFFSILNQFTSTATFLSNGQLITIATATYELQGSNFISKLFCGFVNWIGHIMSDIAGSSGAVTRGSGVVAPFYELFGLCNFGNFNPGGAKMTLAELATRAFEEGYDMRFAMTQTIPVLLCDLLIRLIWSIRRHFGKGYDWKECIPSKKHADLRVMLLFGHGTLCLIDGVDAAIRSGGNPLQAFMHLNLVAWFRFITLVLKEIFIRLKAAKSVQNHIEAYKRINAALVDYLAELEALDIELYHKESRLCLELASQIERTSDPYKLNGLLHAQFERLNIDIPWGNDRSFDYFMKDDSARLIFK